MKKLFMPLIITVLFAAAIAVTVADRRENSVVLAQPQMLRPAVQLAASHTTEPVDPPTHAEQADTAGSAKQILTDIDDANVEERTVELMAAFNRLGKLCDDAVKTADAMLSANFDSESAGDESAEKGAEDGD